MSIATRAVATARSTHAICHIQRRFKSSSSTAIFNVVPEAVKDSIKSSFLEEASRHDSKIWGRSEDHPSAASSPTSIPTQQPNGDIPMNGLDMKQTINTVNGTSTNTTISQIGDASQSHITSDMNIIDNPISPARLEMLYDPLEEWYLDKEPSTRARPEKSDETDPFVLSKSEIDNLSKGIREELIGSDHPVLTKVASYFFEEGHNGGKKVRPMMVLLLSNALSMHSSGDVVGQRPDLYRAQRRLAEISEMIHTASLFHDDVIDGADTRRGSPTVHKVFGNKMAILAGDYLLARASIFLARLRDAEVVETMSTIIEHLVRGEVMQMRGNVVDGRSDLNLTPEKELMIQYLRKNFYKTASLMANSCKSAAILGGYDDSIVSVAYRYGKHLGVAFQLVDDVLDFDGNSSAMGKAPLADLNSGLATAPVLLAAEEFSDELRAMMDRKFREEGDVERAVEMVRASDGIQRTKDLAQVHAELAIDAILELEESKFRDSLIHLAHIVVERSH